MNFIDLIFMNGKVENRATASRSNRLIMTNVNYCFHENSTETSHFLALHKINRVSLVLRVSCERSENVEIFAASPPKVEGRNSRSRRTA